MVTSTSLDPGLVGGNSLGRMEESAGEVAMIEAEWREATRSADLIEFIFFDTAATDRRLRLFACACARRVSQLAGDEAFATVVDLAEAYADGLATADALNARNAASADRCRQLHPSSPPEAKFARSAALRCGYWASERRRELYQPHDLDFPYPLGAAQDAWGAVAYAAGSERRQENQAREDLAQVVILHDIFGNPFRPLTLAAAHRTPTVLSIARAAYDERQLPSGHLHNTRLAILADALEEARCDNRDILDHLRGPGPHVRGCYVVDLILGLS